MTARGIRNNNPGNIRGRYFGATGTDGAFATYATMDDGIRAIDAQLGRYYRGNTTGQPLQTIRDIIGTWAPTNENDTAAYVQAVSHSTGLAPDQRLDWNDRSTRARLAKAIIDHENGAGHPITEERVANVLSQPQPQGLIARPMPAGADAGDMALAIINYQTPLARQLAARMGEAFWNSTPGQALANLRSGEPFAAPDLDPRLRQRMGLVRPDAMSEDDWRTSPFWRERMAWDAAMTPARARAMADIYDENEHRRWLIDQAPNSLWRGALSFAAGMAVQAVDPLNYIPVFGPAARARAIARFGEIGGRALTSAGEAAVTSAAAMPMIATSAARFGDDQSLTDMLIDVSLSAAFGGALGATHGAWARYRGRPAALQPQVVEPARTAMETAAVDVAAGRPASVPRAVAAALRTSVEAVPPRGRVTMDLADRGGSMQRFVAAVDADPRDNAVHMPMAPVDEATAARVREQAATDVAGYTWLIDASGYRHTMQRHGPDGVTTKAGAPATMLADIARIDEIAARAETVRRITTERGLPALEFTTRDNGDVITVSAVRAGRKALALHTMFRRPADRPGGSGGHGGPTGPDAGTPGGAPRGYTPETAADTTDSNIAPTGVPREVTELPSADNERDGGAGGRGGTEDVERTATPPDAEPADLTVEEAARSIGSSDPALAERAEELGLFGDALDAEEMAAFDRLADEGLIDPEDAAAVKEAGEAVDRADGYAAALEEAHLCMFGGA